MAPKRILIISEASDLHSNAVAWALRKKGHDCESLFTPDFPTLLGLSTRVGPGDPAGRFILRGPDVVEEDRSAPFDTVWLRRPGGPVLPEDMHPGDRQVAARQCEIFLAGVAPFLAQGAGTFWVNRAATDWRAGQMYVGMEPYDLPPEIAAGCRRLLREFDLAHMSVDFIVGPDGEHTFLEINPQGQFLFLETRTGLPLLDMFSEFLVAGRRDFTWREDHEIVRFTEFEAHWKQSWRAEAARHAHLIRPLGAPDAAEEKS